MCAICSTGGEYVSNVQDCDGCGLPACEDCRSDATECARCGAGGCTHEGFGSCEPIVLFEGCGAFGCEDEYLCVGCEAKVAHDSAGTWEECGHNKCGLDDDEEEEEEEEEGAEQAVCPECAHIAREESQRREKKRREKKRCQGRRSGTDCACNLLARFCRAGKGSL